MLWMCRPSCPHTSFTEQGGVRGHLLHLGNDHGGVGAVGRRGGAQERQLGSAQADNRALGAVRSSSPGLFYLRNAGRDGLPIWGMSVLRRPGLRSPPTRPEGAIMISHPLPSQEKPLDRRAARLGTTHVLTEANDIASYLVEERGIYRGSALAVVRPRDTAEVAFVVEECARAGVPVVPQGGNTGLVGGGVPYGGVVLSLVRLDRIRAVDPANAHLAGVAGGCSQTSPG